jgi:hypothetical protein
VKYVILIHSNPQPWGHPTSDFLAEQQARSAEERQQANASFEQMLTELSESGELVGAEALAAPSQARLYRWDGGQRVATDGPYSETKEHLAGFFLIDVASQERAEQICERFSGPGETVELRPGWTGGAA